LRPRRIASIVIASGALGLGCLPIVVGCGADESRTSGTQVQLTPDDKAFIEGMRGTMKEHKSESKKAR